MGSSVREQDFVKNLNRSGSRLVQPTTRYTRDGEVVRDVAVIPYSRPRTIKVTARRMRPNIRVHPFINNINVQRYLTPANSSFGSTGSEGDPLETDSSGNLYATLRLPADNNVRFRGGQLAFVLRDIPDLNVQGSVVTTYAQGMLHTGGVPGNPNSKSFCNYQYAPASPSAPKPAPTPTTPSSVTVSESFRYNDGGGVKRKKHFVMGSTSGTVTIIFSFGTAHDKFVLYKNGTALTSTANAVSITAGDLIDLEQNEGLTGSGVSWRNPEAIGAVPNALNQMNNGYVEGAGRITFTHDPSTGRDYIFDMLGRSPWLVKIYYPVDDPAATGTTPVVDSSFSESNLNVDGSSGVVTFSTGSVGVGGPGGG